MGERMKYYRDTKLRKRRRDERWRKALRIYWFRLQRVRPSTHGGGHWSLSARSISPSNLLRQTRTFLPHDIKYQICWSHPFSAYLRSFFFYYFVFILLLLAGQFYAFLFWFSEREFRRFICSCVENLSFVVDLVRNVMQRGDTEEFSKTTCEAGIKVNLFVLEIRPTSYLCIFRSFFWDIYFLNCRKLHILGTKKDMQLIIYITKKVNSIKSIFLFFF